MKESRVKSRGSRADRNHRQLLLFDSHVPLPGPRRRRRKPDARSLFALCVPTAADEKRWAGK